MDPRFGWGRGVPSSDQFLWLLRSRDASVKTIAAGDQSGGADRCESHFPVRSEQIRDELFSTSAQLATSGMLVQGLSLQTRRQWVAFQLKNTLNRSWHRDRANPERTFGMLNEYALQGLI